MIDIWFIVLTNTQGLMVGPLQAIQGAAETGQAGGQTGQSRQLQRGAELLFLGVNYIFSYSHV